MASTVTEKQLQDAVVETAQRLGWQVMAVGKVRDFKGHWRTNWLADGKGWPDLTMTRGARMICAELKVGANKPEPDQKRWRDNLRLIPGVEHYVWHSDDWNDGTVVRVLGGKP